jgi:putative endonuclease
MSHARIAFGKMGEDLAVRELERRGYAVIARRWRCSRGEIDIVARDGETLVFVEVKARDGADFGGGAEAITDAKRRRLVRLALEYLSRERSADRPCRFDVIAVDVSDTPAVTLYQNAFDAGTT